jgi:AcrR family transcriptional regulator
MVRRPREGRTPARRGEETRARILAAALIRFRQRGLDRTTMREIAEHAGVAIGAAYYYFPSKEAIVLAYYDETQRASSARAAEAFAGTDDVRARLGAAFHTKLDVVAKDRKLLSALFTSIADPTADISIFGEKTRAVRDDSIRIFADAVAPSPAVQSLDDASRRVLVVALWSLHMGVMLYFIHDRSKGQAKTRALVDRSLDLVCGLLPVAPELAPIFGGQIAHILAQADLLAPATTPRGRRFPL